jgi:hypothetical protein
MMASIRLHEPVATDRSVTRRMTACFSHTEEEKNPGATADLKDSEDTRGGGDRQGDEDCWDEDSDSDLQFAHGGDSDNSAGSGGGDGSASKNSSMKVSKPPPSSQHSLGPRKWGQAEDDRLCRAVEAIGELHWKAIAVEVRGLHCSSRKQVRRLLRANTPGGLLAVCGASGAWTRAQA